MRLGIILGSFDPIHIGHLNLAASALNLGLVDHVLFVPAYQNPWKEQSKADFWTRCFLTNLAIANMDNCGVSDIEAVTKAPHYSADTLKALQEEHPNDELFLIVGVDVAKQIRNWHDGAWILANVYLITVDRPGYESTAMVDITHTIDVSSTQIRNLAKQGKQLIPWVPELVAKYIKHMKLYE